MDTDNPSPFSPNPARPPRILLRGSWQSVNIGDIGHTPGALSIFAEYLPEVAVSLWPVELGHGSRGMIERCYPSVTIADGDLDEDGEPTTEALEQAWAEADILVHGSSAGVGVAAQQLFAAWRRRTGRAYGFFGVTADAVSRFSNGVAEPYGGTLHALGAEIAALPADTLSAEFRDLLDGAAFVFCRDTLSLGYLRGQGVKTPVLEFGPDATFAWSLRDEARAAEFMAEHGLVAGEFICVVPRLRYTPYVKMGRRPATPETELRDEVNARTVESDHAGLRDMIVRWVRRTGKKVLACPEMTYAIPLAKEQLVDPLPDDVRANVVWRSTYWLPDEAASVYAQAVAVVSVECHSPIIALSQGTPAFYVRQPTDTIKGQMYRDIGVPNWFFEIEEATGEQLSERLLEIYADPVAARAEVARVMMGVRARQRRMADVLGSTISAKTF